MNGRRPQDDEETPLVQSLEDPATRTRTPLPWDQFWVILLLQVSDPFAAQTLAPFTPQVSFFLLNLAIAETLSSLLETSE